MQIPPGLGVLRHLRPVDDLAEGVVVVDDESPPSALCYMIGSKYFCIYTKVEQLGTAVLDPNIFNLEYMCI